MIITNNLMVGYQNKAVLGPVDLHLSPGQMVGILGPNGSGKTTLLNTLAGLLPSVGGEITINRRPLKTLWASQLAKQMALVLTRRVELENTSCFDVAAMGRYPHTGFFGILSQQDRDFTHACLEQCSAEHLAPLPFDQVSEGERQKVLLARGLAQETPILLLDEPTSHLDIKYKLELLSTLRQLTLEEDRLVVCTLHEPDLAVKCCDWLVLVDQGVIQDQGPTHQVLERGLIPQIYGLEPDQLDLLIGSAEFSPSLLGPRVLFPDLREEQLPLLRLAVSLRARVVVSTAAAGSLLERVAQNMGAELLSPNGTEDYREVVLAAAQQANFLCVGLDSEAEEILLQQIAKLPEPQRPILLASAEEMCRQIHPGRRGGSN